MITVRELKGWPHVFTLADGSSLRLLPHKEKKIANSAVSTDLQKGVEMGFVVLLSETPKKKSAVKEHKEDATENQEV